MSEFNRARPISRFVAAAIGCGVAASWAQEPARAPEARVTIAAQPLASALQRFSEQSGLQVGFESDVAKDLLSRGTDGAQQPAAALEQLLEGTGLDYRFVNERTVVIRQSSAGAYREPGGKSPPATRATDTAAIGGEGAFRQFAEGDRLRMAQAGAPAPQENDALQEVVVTGVNFNYNTVESVNKMPLSIKDTPQSVKIITADMINFANITDFNQLYKLDAGSYATHNGDHYSNAFFRGFAAYVDTFKVDGFRILGRGQPDLAAYERVEVVKGATSTMYGQSSVSGTINAISKKPQAGFGGYVSLETGSYDHYRGEFDVYGAATADERLTLRMVGAYENRESYLSFDQTKEIVLAPSLKYQFTPATSMLLQLNYQETDLVPSRGHPLYFTGSEVDPEPSSYRFPNVGRSSSGTAPWAFGHRTSIFARAAVDHEFAGDWTLRGNLQYTNLKGPVARPFFSRMDADGTTDTYLYFDNSSDPVYSAEVNLFGDVELFGRSHTLFLGADYADLKTHTKWCGAFLPGSQTGFNILNPDYSLIEPLTGLAGCYSGGTYDGVGALWGGTYASTRMGVTGQALLRPTEKWTVLVGARHSHSEEKSNQDIVEDFDHLNAFVESPDTNAVTVQTGVTYALTPDINVYGTYGETFEPRAEYGVDPENPDGPGVNLGPLEGETYEAGLKGELFRKTFSWSLALFHTALSNVTQQDPDFPRFSVVVGRQRSKGVELDLQGEVLPGWDVYLSGVAMNNEYVGGDLDGTPSPYGPKFGLTVYTSYEIQSGALTGFGFGGGIVHKKRPDFEYNGVVVEGLSGDYTEADVRAFYDRGPWHYELAATNLFNETYYSALNFPESRLFVNPARQVLGKVVRRF